MDKYAIIVAGGKGLRMGGEIPKQFIPVGGIPVLMRTIKAFRNADSDIKIILVLPRDQQDYWRSLCRQYDFQIPYQLADGGETRFHSVKNGLALVPDGAQGVVGVHDGVRPFVSGDAISRIFEWGYSHLAAVPVVPVVETVRQLAPDGASVTVDRDQYRLVQTPQAFEIATLKRAYQQPYTASFTDDASVVEALGQRVALVEGNRENIKITTPSDLAYAEFLCRD